MKTAISLPDNFAHIIGISCSELYTSAVREYITSHAEANLIEQVNAACDKVDTGLPNDIAVITRRKLLEVEW